MPPDPADYEARNTTADAAYGASISVDTLKNWVSRDPPMVLISREKTGKGNPILYSFARVVQIAIVAELISHGVRHRRAAMAAAVFTDTSAGGTAGGWVGEAMDFSKARLPVQLFPEGLTYLVVPPGTDDDSSNAEVVNVTPATPATRFLHGGRLSGLGVSSAVIVEVNSIVERVRARLAELR